MYATRKVLTVNAATLTRFVRGDISRLGAAKREALSAHWRVRWPDLERLIRHRSTS